jgi:hypothetical protein
MRLAFDIDGVCVSKYTQLFSTLIGALMKSPDVEIFIISSRENSKISRKETEQELKDLGVFYDFLILTDDKQKEIKDNNIDMFIDNEIEQINSVKNNAVCCLLLKEKYNYCWESNRLLGSKETVKMID